MLGLIVENIANLYKIKFEEKIYTATARGKLKSCDTSPVVGDNVEFEVLHEDKQEAIIERVINRKIFVKRPKIANLTQCIYVVSSINPKPDLLMLDKQLVFSEYLGLKSIIVLNKIDLDKLEVFRNIKQLYEKIGYTVIETDAKDRIGIEKLREKMKNNISAFSGNSGVGKSTLINCIFKESITEEGEISKKNKKGKNTTTAIKLYKIEENTYIADTPGFSTFDISEIKTNELDKYFIEFRNRIQGCKFVGCTHIKEQNCGIKVAMQDNNISKSRYNNYVKIYNELKEKEEHKW